MTLEDDIWTFIGINTGYFIKWPLIPDERNTIAGEPHMNQCEPYECRRRPWYVGAVSGPKDIIIMIDRSGSMQSKWKITIDSAIELILSLTFADYVSVILFSNEGVDVLINENNLIKFDSKLKKDLEIQLEKEKEGNKDTNFTIGFEKAFDIFINSKSEINSEDRAKMVVVIGDGNTGEVKSEVLEYIKGRQQEMYEIYNEIAIIHSLIIKTDKLDTSLMRQISCQNTGMSLLLENEDDLLSELITGFLSYNALTSNRSTTVWIEPFENFSGLGEITSVAKPIFSE